MAAKKNPKLDDLNRKLAEVAPGVRVDSVRETTSDAELPRRSSMEKAKLQALRQQRELLRRLCDDLDARKEGAKAARLRVEQAQRDLERMVADSAQGELFPGKLVIDAETGEVLDYDRPDLGDDPLFSKPKKEGA